MKNVFTYLVSILLASLIFYGGSGVNLMTYCCGDCRAAGVEVVLTDKCCEIHDHNHGEAEQACHSHHQHGDCGHAHEIVTDGLQAHICENDCCDLERLNFEWENGGNTNIVLEPVQIDLLYSLLPSATLLTSTDKQEYLFAEQDSPPLVVCPRVYLSLLTTLLI